ncbi:MAG: hypothetical protein ACR2QF_03725, partial [Geminicoccaceae bacterium]
NRTSLVLVRHISLNGRFFLAFCHLCKPLSLCEVLVDLDRELVKNKFIALGLSLSYFGLCHSPAMIDP